MTKAWRVIIFIVLSAILLGAVCIGVGLITGADAGRIYSILDDRYMINDWLDWVSQSVSAVMDAIFPAEGHSVIVIS